MARVIITFMAITLLSAFMGCGGGGGVGGNETPETKLRQASLSFAQPSVTIAVDENPAINQLSGGSGSGRIRYASSDVSVASVNETTGEITIIGGGITTITAVKHGDATYQSASASYTLNVSKLEQAPLVFESENVLKQINDESFAVPLFGGSGTGAIAYSSSDPSIASVDTETGEVIVVAPGTTTITAFKNGDAVYLGASVSYVLEVVIYVEPGEYATISECLPFQGSEFSELKIMFINLSDAPHFDALVQNAIDHQFKAISPFSEFVPNMAFYKLDISAEGLACEGMNGSESFSGFKCDIEQLHQAIAAECRISDIYGIIKVVIGESIYGGSASEAIYVGSKAHDSEAMAIQLRRNAIIHEVGHNLGLADLYGGSFNTNGLAEFGWSSAISREWLNLDGPGCPKWCDMFKPPSEYTLSPSAQCHTFETKDACMAFNRDADGFCDADDDGVYNCCGWSEKKDDYFDSQCTPAWGTENIGLACRNGAGCFYGGAYGISSWRPVRSWEESIMYGPAVADSFDSVSEAAIREVMRCCASQEDSTASCAGFRQEFADFLFGAMLFKQRVGSCGISPIE